MARTVSIVALLAVASCSSPPPSPSPAPAPGPDPAMVREIARLRLENFILRARLARAGTDPAPLATLLRDEGLRAPEPVLRLAALTEFLQAPDPRALSALSTDLEKLVFLEPEPAVLEKAIDALILVPGPGTPAAVRSALDRASTDGVRWSAINAVGKLDLHDAAPAVRTHLDPAQPESLRVLSLQVLGKLADAEAAAEVRALLARDSSERVREAAASALARFGPEASQAPLLSTFLSDGSAAVRRAAWRELLAGATTIPALDDLATSVLPGGWRPELAEFGARAAALNPKNGDRARAARMLERLAAWAGSARESAILYRHALAVTTPDAGLLSRAAASFRKAGDFEACLQAADEALSKMPPGDPQAWDLKLERLAALEGSGAMAPAAVEARSMADLAKTAEARTQLEAARRRIEAALVGGLCAVDDAAHRRSVDAARKVGKPLLPILAQAVLEPLQPDAVPRVLEVGNSLAGTGFSVADLKDADRRKALRAAWR